MIYIQDMLTKVKKISSNTIFIILTGISILTAGSIIAWHDVANKEQPANTNVTIRKDISTPNIKAKNNTSQSSNATVSTHTAPTQSTNSKSSSISYCPLSNGQFVVNNSGTSCIILDQGECWAYSTSVNSSFYNSVKQYQDTVETNVSSLIKSGDSTQDINNTYNLANAQLHNLYETYIKNFSAPYPNCSPLPESQAYVPFSLL